MMVEVRSRMTGLTWTDCWAQAEIVCFPCGPAEEQMESATEAKAKLTSL